MKGRRRPLPAPAPSRRSLLPPLLPSSPRSAQRGPDRRPRLSLRAGAARARGACVPRVALAAGPAPRPPRPPRPLVRRGRASASPLLDRPPRSGLLCGRLRPAPGLGAARASRGSGQSGWTGAVGRGALDSDESRASGPLRLPGNGAAPPPSAWAARRYRRPEAPRGGTARPPRAPSLRFGVAPTPPALPSALPSLILPMLG